MHLLNDAALYFGTNTFTKTTFPPEILNATEIMLLAQDYGLKNF